jgi:tRNA threonylcarbamoyladenosine biosynthesis protein TsaB
VRIVALDTATEATAVALCDDDAGLALEARDDPAPGERPRHQTRLLALIVELLERAGGGWEHVDRIAVGVGPGTFTGLRIGIATARALAQARGIPLVGVSTLHSLALNGFVREVPPVQAAPGRIVLAALDARRGEVFAAAWRIAATAGELERIVEPAAVSPEALAALVSKLAPLPLALGTGAIEFRAQLERAGAMVPADDSELHRITAINHCQLATGLPASTPAEVRPEYLRLPDAELALRKTNLN